MKRGVQLLFICIILLNITLALAQSTSPTASTPENKKVLDTKNITSKLNERIDKEIQVPAGLQLLIKIIFGIEKTISISLLIIVLCIWLFSFIFIANILKLTPFFKGWIAIPAGICITILIALSGAIKNIALFLLNFGDSFAFLAKWGAGAVLLIMVAILAITFVATSLLKKLRKKLEREEAQEEGSKMGLTIGMMAKFKEMFGFTQKIH